MTYPTRAYGDRYSATKDLDIAEIAKLVRADIKEAVKTGYLPGKPVAYSVRIERYSMGQSINIIIKHADFPVYEYAKDWTGYERSQLTGQAREVKARLDDLLNAYNYDGSDILTDYFDVRFYGHAEYDWKTTPEAVR